MRERTFKELPEQENLCRFNYGISCTQHDKCERCGWNPEEEERRNRERKEKECEKE